MAVYKVNGFDVPYRSQTFQNQAQEIAQASGLLRMDDSIQMSGGLVVIPPFEFIQNGLIVTESASRTRPEPSQEAPYFLTVSAATTEEIDDLSFQFPKSPSDISVNQVIIGYWDGIEWRKPQILSLSGIYQDINQANIDFKRTGPFSGLVTSVVATNYETTGGVVVDRQGLRQSMTETAVNPIVAVDSDYQRVDRIVYRRPKDSTNRIGWRKFVLGGAHDLTVTGVHETQFISASVGQPHVRTKVLIGTDNSAHLLTMRGYGNTYYITYTKYNSDRTAVLVATSTVVSAVYDKEFSAAIDASNNVHVFYTSYVSSKTVIKWTKLSSVGSILLTTTPHSHSVAPLSRPAVCYNKDQDALFVVDQAYLGVGNNKIFFFSMQASDGSIMRTPMQLSMGTGDLQYPAVCISNDYDLYVACEEVFSQRIMFGKFDDIGTVREAAASISSNTEHIGFGTRTDLAKRPQIRVSDNKNVFVTFLQDKTGSGVFGMAIWSEGYAFIQQLLSSGENFTDYDVALDDFLNGLHFILAQSTATHYAKIEGQIVQLSYEIDAASSADVSTARDNRGAMLHVWAEPLPAAYTIYDPANTIRRIGPGTEVGTQGSVVLTNAQLVVMAAYIATPRVGEQLTVSGSSAGNDGSRVITAVEQVTLDSTLDAWKITCASPIFSAEGTSPTLLADFAYPDGNNVNFVKTNSELSIKAYRYDVLNTDLLLARLSFPGPVALNWSNTSPDPQPADTAKLIMYGADVTIDWSYSVPGSVTIGAGLHIVDLVNTTDYLISAGSYAMSEGQALYATLDLITNPVTLEVTNISTLPWSTPIQVLGVIEQGNFVPHAVLSNLDIEEMEPGEVDTTGHDLPDIIRARLGIVSETAFQPYDNSYNFLLTDNYPTALSKLDARTYDIMTDFNDEEVYEVTSALTDYTSAGMVWDGANTAHDIIVFVNGKKQTQDTTGASLKDYKKLDVNQLRFTYTVPVGAEIAIFKIRKGGGHPGFLITRDEGVQVNPITQYMNFFGDGVTCANGGSGLVNVHIPGGPAFGKTMVKGYKNTSGSSLPAGTVCAFDTDGGLVLADANITTLSDFAGITKVSITAGNFGDCYKLGDVPGILTGMGAIPGQLVYLGETPGTMSLSPPSSLTDNIIILGRAEIEDGGNPNGVATALFLSPQIISAGV